MKKIVKYMLSIKKTYDLKQKGKTMTFKSW